VTLERAQQWMAEVHPHNRHLERTLDWLLVLDPGASEAARIAAATHDVERAYPDGDAPWDSARDWDSVEYNRWHQDRCADMIGPGLRDRGASAELADARLFNSGQTASAPPRSTCLRCPPGRNAVATINAYVQVPERGSASTEAVHVLAYPSPGAAAAGPHRRRWEKRFGFVHRRAERVPT